MYMIGQVAALKNDIISLAELHRMVGEDSIGYIREAFAGTSPGEGSGSLEVAIVGMACIYPGARNIDEFWRNIVLGKDAVTEVPDERWNKEIYYDPSATGGDKSASKWGGFLPVVDFDPVEFGIPPQSLAAIEPAQLLSLLVAREALKNAGYADREFDRENVSVIMAADGGNDLENLYRFRGLFPQLLGEMPKELDAALPRLTEDSFPGVLANVIAGRICNRLDLGGRNFSVDAACASSLAAVDLACQELQLGKADMVLAGAADLHNSINDYLLFSSTRALSKTGKCMTFDSAADGIALGEGVAMLVLKRYEDAKRDGDTVYAIIKGVGGSSDGKSLGLTAPRKKGQRKALERAYEQAGLSPAEAGLIEAHGTGTVVGDQTELSALSDLFLQSGAIAGQTSLGSVKTQIGHTKCAAGLAGLIKAALSVYHGVKPPTLHIKAPNRGYAPRLSPFRFDAEAGPWLEPSRIAGISAFGFGGTNFHVVIASESRMGISDRKAPPVIQSWPAELFVFRGDDYEEARGVLATCRSILLNNDKLSFIDLAYSLAVRNGKDVQLSIVADTVEDLLLKMDLALSGAVSDGIFVREEKEGKVAFLFPGQGSQRVNMARSLLTIFPAMREGLLSNPEYGRVLYPHSVFDEGSLRQQKDEIRDTRLAQPLLGIVDLAIAGFLRDLGIEPAMVAGHSYGELPALCFAGAFGPQDLVPLSESRARAILDATGDDKGIMIALNCEPGMLNQLTGEGSGIYAVNHNSPEQWVLAGATGDMQVLMEKLKAQEIWFSQLGVACAFHSPLVAGARLVFEEAMKDVVFDPPSVAVWSNTTASVYPP
ncbi:MAG TPA: beta-ketoacyl synthase N-terminal-like domain-containing protein, partial [Puia sp.]|nr:beta-ketoacyl synthase N-terminal-like domain-containing protein [Puia sp.]